MRLIRIGVVLLAWLTVACEPAPEYMSQNDINATVTAAVATAQAALKTPSSTPTLTPSLTTTPLPSSTTTASSTPTATPTTTLTPTLTRTPTRTATVGPSLTPTLTPAPPGLNSAFLGCTTGIDILHGLGEVTNAYVRVRNTGGAELTNVCLTLSANDEGRRHPDNTHCFSSLRPNYEVTTKLTVDTQYRKLTMIQVIVATNQGVTDKVSRSDCRELNNANLNQINPILNIPRPIQGP